MDRYAIIDDAGMVVTVVTPGFQASEDVPRYEPGPGLSAIEVPADHPVCAGWRWTSKGGFLAPPPPPPPSRDERRSAARAACAARILAQANAATQANMSLYAGVLALVRPAARTPAQNADASALAEAAAWIAAMRARWPEIAEQELDPADDANWPEPSAPARALAARF